MVVSGRTYREIYHVLKVPKSTLSTWFAKKIKRPFTRSEMLAHLASIRPRAMAILTARAGMRRAQEDARVREIVKGLNNTFQFRDIVTKKALLAMLYWAEGAKHEGVHGITFVNTDPRLAQLFIILLRQCYLIKEEKFSIRLNLHYYHSKAKAITFWSKQLSVPREQFTKPHFKKRHNTRRFRKNFAGICSIYYGDNAIRKEMLEFAYSIQNSIMNGR